MRDGYSRSEARGHPRVKKGELGVRSERDYKVRLIRAGSTTERRQIRREILEEFFRRIDEPIEKFKTRRQWRDRMRKYEPIAERISRRFTIEKNEVYSLLFSP